MEAFDDKYAFKYITLLIIRNKQYYDCKYPRTKYYSGNKYTNEVYYYSMLASYDTDTLIQVGQQHNGLFPNF